MTYLIKSIIDTTKERIKTPFVGTFVFAWLVFNWRPVSVFFFSKHGIEARINMINLEYSDILNCILWPLLLAIVYMMLIPSFSLAFDWIMKEVHFKRKDFKNAYVLKDIDLDIKKADKEAELEDAKANYKEKFDLNKQISDLKTKEEKLKANEEKLNEKLSNLKSEAELDKASIENLQNENKHKEEMVNKMLESNNKSEAQKTKLTETNKTITSDLATKNQKLKELNIKSARNKLTLDIAFKEIESLSEQINTNAINLILTDENGVKTFHEFDKKNNISFLNEAKIANEKNRINYNMFPNLMIDRLLEFALIEQVSEFEYTLTDRGFLFWEIATKKHGNLDEYKIEPSVRIKPFE